jgi:hypothetical protein
MVLGQAASSDEARRIVKNRDLIRSSIDGANQKLRDQKPRRPPAWRAARHHDHIIAAERQRHRSLREKAAASPLLDGRSADRERRWENG